MSKDETITTDDKVIVLKTSNKVFPFVMSGHKTAEWRKMDRDFQTGNILILEEYNCDSVSEANHVPTGRKAVVQITHILTDDFGVPKEYGVLSFKLLGATRP